MVLIVNLFEYTDSRMELLIKRMAITKNTDAKTITQKLIFATFSVSQCIIYCNSKKRVNELGNTLKTNDFPVLMIHGELNSNERKDIMERFKGGEARILISTDLLARGIDVQQLSLVINFDLPIDNETYIDIVTI